MVGCVGGLFVSLPSLAALRLRGAHYNSMFSAGSCWYARQLMNGLARQRRKEWVRCGFGSPDSNIDGRDRSQDLSRPWTPIVLEERRDDVKYTIQYGRKRSVRVYDGCCPRWTLKDGRIGWVGMQCCVC
ncbi:hypothetical protein GGR53DRAFT_507605 [Hypoxylon sp. FL1150]|nr:hypothetical protein GGR53DRAFT_507605 [Hypoxylon sp. FL1150]